MLFSKVFNNKILNLQILLLSLFFLSCSVDSEFNGDINKEMEEGISTVVYFKKDATSPVSFTKLYKIGKDYSASDLPSMYSSDVWDMYPGYDLGGWKTDDYVANLETDANGYVTSFHMTPRSITLYGDGYLASSRTPYTIVIQKERLSPVSPYLYDPKEYEYFTTITAQGTTNTNTNVSAHLPSIPGFIDPSSGTDYMDDNINAAGDTIIYVTVRRKDNILITVQDTTGTPAYVKSYGPGVFEAPVVYDPAPARDGYTISGWTQITPGTLEETTIASLPETYPAYNYEYNPIWQPMQVSYTVVHKLQNTDLSTYTVDTTETKSGTTDTQTAATARSYTGFGLASPVVQENINGDGSTEVEINYNRIRYSLFCDGNGGANSSGNESLEYYCYYGKPKMIPSNEFERSGYTFKGWARTKARADAGTIDYGENADYIIGAGNATIYAVWQPNAIEITISLPDEDGITIACETTDTDVILKAVHADGSLADPSEYTFNWFYTADGIGSPQCTDNTWTIARTTLGTGTKQISLIATKDGIPSGGTIQLDISD